MCLRLSRDDISFGVALVFDPRVCTGTTIEKPRDVVESSCHPIPRHWLIWLNCATSIKWRCYILLIARLIFYRCLPFRDRKFEIKCLYNRILFFFFERNEYWPDFLNYSSLFNKISFHTKCAVYIVKVIFLRVIIFILLKTQKISYCLHDTVILNRINIIILNEDSHFSIYFYDILVELKRMILL